MSTSPPPYFHPLCVFARTSFDSISSIWPFFFVCSVVEKWKTKKRPQSLYESIEILVEPFMAPQVYVQSSVCFVSLFRVAVQRVSVFDLLADGLKLSHELSPFMHGQTHHRGINLSFLTFAKSRLEIGKS